jgi:hypothetical protein
MKNLKYAGLSLIMLISATGQKVVAAASRHEEKRTDEKTRLRHKEKLKAAQARYNEVRTPFEASTLYRLLSDEIDLNDDIVCNSEADTTTKAQAQKNYDEWYRAYKQASEWAVGPEFQRKEKIRIKVQREDIKEKYDTAVAEREAKRDAFRECLKRVTGRMEIDDEIAAINSLTDLENLRELMPLAQDRLNAAKKHLAVGEQMSFITGETFTTHLGRAQRARDRISQRLVEWR